MMGLVYRKLKDSVPFIHDQFDEAMEKTVTAAKAEVEAFALHAAWSAGCRRTPDEAARPCRHRRR
jgi:hypothetical protein